MNTPLSQIPKRRFYIGLHATLLYHKNIINWQNYYKIKILILATTKCPYENIYYVHIWLFFDAHSLLRCWTLKYCQTIPCGWTTVSV